VADSAPQSQKREHQDDGDSYSVHNISESANQAQDKMDKACLRLKLEITSGEHVGNKTDIFVQPVVHTVPISDPDPDPDADASESNRTIFEEEEGGLRLVISIK
jgi:hypothetical protein